MPHDKDNEVTMSLHAMNNTQSWFQVSKVK